MASATTFTMMMHILCLTLCSLSLFCSAFTSQDYSNALEKSILFFEGQRSGKLPSNQRLTWRGNSGQSDGSSYHVTIILFWFVIVEFKTTTNHLFQSPQKWEFYALGVTFFFIICTINKWLNVFLLVDIFQVDLVGGYYDAGDNVKFGLPMAFTTTLLSWSVIEFGNSMHNQIENARAAIKWSTDYLLKAATAAPNTLYVQVSKSNMHLSTNKEYG